MIWQRLVNLWKLSDGRVHSGELDKEKVESLWDKIEKENAPKLREKAIFIPRIKIDPAQAIINEETP